jgi:uncharacterized protein
LRVRFVHDAQVNLIVQAVLAWATAQPKIRAVALVGSHARGTARLDSDIDLVLLTTDPEGFRMDASWVEQIDWHTINTRPQEWQDEDYGAAWSRRVLLEADCEQVELTFASLFWANTSAIDAGTQRVIAGSCQILYDFDALLGRLCEWIGQRESTE